ncbi:hypothetical protein L1987_79855 [Smallanthus sonchifolius]|uniref:Uncharacterized protein n=1 Tax=Smallanthus sonchifolius TaxID=185202 RepID=A0ACB8YKC8_9ASTR|nr:hypothetical protein L1987_79855 [Smallanthus sonchifolius]
MHISINVFCSENVFYFGISLASAYLMPSLDVTRNSQGGISTPVGSVFVDSDKTSSGNDSVVVRHFACSY